MSSSAICSHFTQNAWKKDLCSNCFKSKGEHKSSNNSGMSLHFTTMCTTQTPIEATPSNAAIEINGFSNTNIIAATAETSDSNYKITDYPNKYKMPVKSIIKKAMSNSIKPLTISKNSIKNQKVCFPKHLSEVIGYGGEWSDDSFADDDDHNHADFMNLGNELTDEYAATSTDDEDSLELRRITISNTDFNMNNGNLLRDAQENIKRSFAALKLGAPQIDKEGKKQTLKINVVPFGCNAVSESTNTIPTTIEKNAEQTMNEYSTKNKSHKNNSNYSVKAKFESKTDVSASKAKPTQSESKASPNLLASITATSKTTNNVDKNNDNYLNKSTKSVAIDPQHQQQTEKKTNEDSSRNCKKSPPVERAMEKSLLDEISETLEQNQNDAKKILKNQGELQAKATTNKDSQTKLKFEITSLTDALDEINKPFHLLKKSISRNPPITKEHTKPKVNIFPNYITSDTESNCSDIDNGVSAYYDGVESHLSYVNLPDGENDKLTTKTLKEKQEISSTIE